jgi:hypothetical protein
MRTFAFILFFAAAQAATAQVQLAGTITDPAATLHARFTALQGELSRNAFRRPVHLESREGANDVTGEIYAHVAYPFAVASAGLEKPSQWCDVLILHLNTKYCRPDGPGSPTILHVDIGKKFDQPRDEAYRVDFDYRVSARSANYLQVKLSAAEGPLSTRDYRIDLEATPADDGGTYIRLSYSYGFGMLGKIALQAYLASIGRHKVGFTVDGAESDGTPRYIGGTRGLVERNTMRYYLAIESYLGALALPAPARIEKSLRDWYTATEIYARQLHEMTESEYLDMKRKEYTRQQADSGIHAKEPS